MQERDSDVSVAETSINNGSYLIGAVGALLGALIGAIPWAVAYYFGWFVGWLGFLIGICAVKGYGILRGKSGWPAVFIMILAVIIGVVTGQILGDFLDIYKYIANGEIDWATYSDIPRLYFLLLFEDSEILMSTLGNLLLGFVFAGLGVWRIVKNMVFELKSGNRIVPEQISAENSLDEQR